MSDSVLLEEEWVRLLVLLCVFISEVLKHDCLFGRFHWVQVIKWLIVSFLKFFERSPFMRGVFTDVDLTRVGLTSQVYLFSVDLVWDVNQEHIEEIVTDVIWLEDDLYFIRFIGSDRSLLGHEDIRDLFLVVFDSVDLGLKVEVYWERRYVLDLECFLSLLADENVAKGQDTILWCDLDFRSNSCTLEKD